MLLEQRVAVDVDEGLLGVVAGGVLHVEDAVVEGLEGLDVDGCAGAVPARFATPGQAMDRVLDARRFDAGPQGVLVARDEVAQEGVEQLLGGDQRHYRHAALVAGDHDAVQRERELLVQLEGGAGGGGRELQHAVLVAEQELRVRPPVVVDDVEVGRAAEVVRLRLSRHGGVGRRGVRGEHG